LASTYLDDVNDHVYDPDDAEQAGMDLQPVVSTRGDLSWPRVTGSPL
jgi:hypothetical protein